MLPPTLATKENGRGKSTINLQNFLKAPPPSPEKMPAATPTPLPERKIGEEELRQAWDDFAELRKTQTAEYQLLKRGFTFQEPVITVSLSNAIEEPLLQNMMQPLITFLREQLQNHRLSVHGILTEAAPHAAIYTNKEKFEHLAGKNPALRKLKETLGLDPDF